MIKEGYKVNRRVKKIIFMPPYIVYDVVKVSRLWSGGAYGDWYKHEKRLATFAKLDDANKMCNELQENK